MRLVPTFTSILSINNKTKFALCLAHQVALGLGPATAVTWEMTTNLLLDKIDPACGISFRNLMMSLPPIDKPGTTLFHTIDRQFRSDNIMEFTFRPENASDARNIIAGLVPFLRDEGYSFFLKMFSAEALQFHASSTWNSAERTVKTAKGAELANLLAADDELNFSDEPTHELPTTTASNTQIATPETFIAIDIPPFPSENFPAVNKEDSISTFHPTVRTTLEPSGHPTSNSQHDDADTLSRMSDTASKISSLETNLSDLLANCRFKLNYLRNTSVTSTRWPSKSVYPT